MILAAYDIEDQTIASRPAGTDRSGEGETGPPIDPDVTTRPVRGSPRAWKKLPRCVPGSVPAMRATEGMLVSLPVTDYDRPLSSGRGFGNGGGRDRARTVWEIILHRMESDRGTRGCRRRRSFGDPVSRTPLAACGASWLWLGSISDLRNPLADPYILGLLRSVSERAHPDGSSLVLDPPVSACFRLFCPLLVRACPVGSLTIRERSSCRGYRPGLRSAAHLLFRFPNEQLHPILADGRRLFPGDGIIGARSFLVMGFGHLRFS